MKMSVLLRNHGPWSLTTCIVESCQAKVDFKTLEGMNVPHGSTLSLDLLMATVTCLSPFQLRKGLVPAFGPRSSLTTSQTVLAGRVVVVCHREMCPGIHRGPSWGQSAVTCEQ